jgi:hypothetical protein
MHLPGVSHLEVVCLVCQDVLTKVDSAVAGGLWTDVAATPLNAGDQQQQQQQQQQQGDSGLPTQLQEKGYILAAHAQSWSSSSY